MFTADLLLQYILAGLCFCGGSFRSWPLLFADSSVILVTVVVVVAIIIVVFFAFYVSKMCGFQIGRLLDYDLIFFLSFSPFL